MEYNSPFLKRKRMAPYPMSDHLPEDVDWKRIQQNTFTRWVNEKLKGPSESETMSISNLETDLQDGLKLIRLVESLSAKKVGKFNKKPNFRSQKLENVSVALKFLAQKENIKLVNIDSSDIVDCKIKLILGLIWTLILHYSISTPEWEGEEQVPEGSKGPSPKERLLGWVTTRLPNLPVKNFTTDWQDGRAVGALVDSVAPGLCPDWDGWVPADALKNTTEAMTLADDWLGVPQLLSPEDVINPNRDELSMMTYLAQYPSAKLKEGAPLRPKTDPSKVRCFGPGLEVEGIIVNTETYFVMETLHAGKGDLEASIIDSSGEKKKLYCVDNHDSKKSYTCTYSTQVVGRYTIVITFNGINVGKSPYEVSISPPTGDSSKVTVSGDGIKKEGTIVGEKATFYIDVTGAGQGVPHVIILDSKGNKTTTDVIIEEEKGKEGIYRCDYVTTQTGLHSINVFFNSEAIPGSPFGARSSPVYDASKVKALGRGLQPVGIRVKDEVYIRLDPSSAGKATFKVQLTTPDGKCHELDPKCDEEGIYTCRYVPEVEGSYSVSVQYGGDEVHGSPYKVEVYPKKNSKIKVFGPGLSSGMVNFPAVFTVETNGETGALGFKIEGPSHAKLDCKDNEDGTADVSYNPTVEGQYAIHVLQDNEDIPNSPFMAYICSQKECYPDRVACIPVDSTGKEIHMNGTIEQYSDQTDKPSQTQFNVTEELNNIFSDYIGTKVSQGEQIIFKVDAKNAGCAPLDVEVLDENYKQINVDNTLQSDGTHLVSYHPPASGKHTLQVNYGGVAVKGSPFRPSKSNCEQKPAIRVYGPGLESGVQTQSELFFTIDCREADADNLSVFILLPDGTEKEAIVEDNNDGTFDVKYHTLIAGAHKVRVQFREYILSTFTVHVKEKEFKVKGFTHDTFMDSKSELEVDLYTLSQIHPEIVDKSRIDKAFVQCWITNPFNEEIEVQCDRKEDEYFISYTPIAEGAHQVNLQCNGHNLPGFPCIMDVHRGIDKNVRYRAKSGALCKAFGEGLHLAYINNTNEFTVTSPAKKTEGIEVVIDGPSKCKPTQNLNDDGTVSIRYIPKQVGKYHINVLQHNKHIDCSPFMVEAVELTEPKSSYSEQQGTKTKAGQDKLPDQTKQKMSKVKCNSEESKVDPNKVIMWGDGIDKTKIREGIQQIFHIDTKHAGPADLEIGISDEHGNVCIPTLTKSGPYQYDIAYYPCNAGQKIFIYVLYDGQHVKDSPCITTVKPKIEPEKVKLAEDKHQINVKEFEEKHFTVDTSEAGVGDLTVVVTSPDGRRCPVSVKPLSDGKYDISHVPDCAGDWKSEIQYGGIPISTKPLCYHVDAVQDKEEIIEQFTQETRRGSKLECANQSSICSDTRSDVESIHDAHLFDTIELEGIPVDPALESQIEAIVERPSKINDPAYIDNCEDGTVNVKYHPKEEGKHTLNIYQDNEHVQGSPYNLHVSKNDCASVTAKGQGLIAGIAGEMCNFTVCTKNAVDGGLTLAVEGPSKAEVNCNDNKDGTLSVSYLPIVPGKYKISVKYAEEHIVGSPFSVNITGSGRKKGQVCHRADSLLNLPCQLPEKDSKLPIRGYVVLPNGEEDDCDLEVIDENLSISFMPRMIGEHWVHISQGETKLADSPFKIYIQEHHLPNPSKIKVYGEGLSNGFTNQENKFYIDTTDAGHGGINVAVVGPSKANVNCQIINDREVMVTYHPTQPGKYKINVNFDNESVVGSPFISKVVGLGAPKQFEKMQEEIESVKETNIGDDCILTFNLDQLSHEHLTAKLVRPSGQSEYIKIVPAKHGGFSVQFVPKEIGVHFINVEHQGIEINGSPFKFTVGKLSQGGAKDVHVGGSGIERGVVSAVNEFSIWTREAGKGNLNVCIEGPSKAVINSKNMKDGTINMFYKVASVGEYKITILFDNEHIPGSPFKVYAAPSPDEASKVVIEQFPKVPLKIGDKCKVGILKQGVVGDLDCKLICPSGKEDYCYMTNQDNADHIKFTVYEIGDNYLHIKMNDFHIQGSPFRLPVEEKIIPKISGSGLEHCLVGKPANFVLDTQDIIPDTLDIDIAGPAKVNLECEEVKEGYQFTYTAVKIGIYKISVKYDKYAIEGSPFKVLCEDENVTMQSSFEEYFEERTRLTVNTNPNISQKQRLSLPKSSSNVDQITSQGLGLTQAYVDTQNNFVVDASKAGNNILYVGIYGPKTPCEEVYIKHIGNNIYKLSYIVREAGNYIIIVKWGEHHIPGSPFHVHV